MRSERIGLGVGGYLLLYLALFSFVLNPTLSIGGIVIPLAALSLVLFFLYICVRPKISFAIGGVLFYFCVFWGFLGIYSVLVEMVLWGGPLGYFLKIAISNVVYVLFALSVLGYIVRCGGNIDDLFKVLFYISLLNSTIILIEFLLPPFREGVEAVLHQSIGSNIDYQNVDWRLRGFASAGGASLSVFMGFSICVGWLANRKGRLSDYVFLFGSSLILVSTMLVGRTGLIYGGLLFCCWLFLQMFSLNARAFLSFVVLSVLLSMFGGGMFSEFERIIPFAMELFINFVDGGSLNTASTSELVKMLSVPDEMWSILFGFGAFEGDFLFRSDSGYIKTIFAVGIVFTFILYAFYMFFLVFYPLIHKLKIGFPWYLGVALLFVMEVKEPMLYQNYTARCLILIVVCFAALRGNLGRC